MPRIIVTTDAVSSELSDGTPVLLDERVHSVHLSTGHAAAQLVERLAWAVRDAESAELTEPPDPADATQAAEVGEASEQSEHPERPRQASPSRRVRGSRPARSRRSPRARPHGPVAA